MTVADRLLALVAVGSGVLGVVLLAGALVWYALEERLEARRARRRVGVREVPFGERLAAVSWDAEWRWPA